MRTGNNLPDMPVDEFNIAQKNRAARELMRLIDKFLVEGNVGSVGIRIPIQRRGRELKLGNIRRLIEEEV